MDNSGSEILLNPGPVNLSQKVREALSDKDVCHRELEFAKLVQYINKRLGEVYSGLSGCNYQSVLLTASGTGAVEAMLTSFIPRESITLVIDNGVYGARMQRILKSSNRDHQILKFDWQRPIDVALIDKKLNENQEIENLVLVHHETTTGRLNPLLEIGEVCKEHDVRLFLDAVSSFGAEEILGEEINLTALAGTANKCLHGAPGISFVMAHPDVWSDTQTEPSTVYFNLFDYFHAQYADGFSPFTPATHVAFAFKVALDEFFDSGGWPQRNRLFDSRDKKIAEALSELGVETLLQAADFSSVLYSYILPTGVSFAKLHDFLKTNGFVIYQGQGDLSETIFRISTMGEISEEKISLLCDLFNEFLGS